MKQDTVQKQPPDVFCKKGVLRNVAKLTRKHLRQSVCEFCEISKNTFSAEHLRVDCF